MNVRPLVCTMVIGAGLTVAAVGRPVRAQPAAGNYVRVATIEESVGVVPPGLWHSPSGIDVAGAEVFVADARLRRITVHSPDGSFLRELAPAGAAAFVAPEHVGADPARDRVYVTDPGAGRLSVLTMSGAPVDQWPIGGPAGVAVAPDGRVVVTDQATDRVRVFKPDGTEEAGFGGTGTGAAQLDHPGGVTVAPDGVAWVADRGNVRVVAATLDGTAVRSFRLNAAQFAGDEPLDVALGGPDLWVAGAGGVYRFDLASGLLRGRLEGASASAVAADGSAALYAAVQPFEGDPGVWRYSAQQSSGDPQARWSGPLLVPGLFDGLESVTVGDDGKLWLLDVPPRIQRLSGAGVAEAQIAAPDPVEVDVDAAGAVYAATADAVIGYAPDGTERWRAEVRASSPTAEADVVGIGWDQTGARVVVLDAGGRRMLYFAADGTPQGEWQVRGGESGATWVDLSVGHDGSRYALDAANRQILGWDGVDQQVVEIDLPDMPVRFDTAADGSFVVLFTGGFAGHFSRDGAVRAIWDAARLDLGASMPVDVAVNAAGRVLVADGGVDVITVSEWDSGAPPYAPPEVEEGCVLTPTKTASPREIYLGETVEIALQLRGKCAGSRSQADVALLIDTAMDRGRLKAARTAAESFVDLVDAASDLVVVQPGDNGGRLTNDRQLLRRQIRRVEPTEAFDIGQALSSSEEELFGRRGRMGVKKVVILLHGSPLDDALTWWERSRIERAAGQLKRRGAEIFVIALGIEEQIHRDIATDRDHVIHGRGTWELVGLYALIAEEIKPSVLLDELVLTDELPANMEYVEGSAEPPAVVTGRILEWRIAPVPLNGVGVRFRVRPTEEGEWPTNVHAGGTYTEPGGAAGTVDFPIPRVRVSRHVPTAAPTVAATASPTVPATASPTASATRGTTPTPVFVPVPLYLPVALLDACQATHVDIALVLDASTSMGEGTGPARKINGATAAARMLLDQLDFSRDQAAVVIFHNRSVLLQELTSDRAALDAALGSIELESESRLDLGVIEARVELLGPNAKPANEPAMIVLTDGRANPVPASVAVAEAATAKEAGVTIFTVAIGEDVDTEALRDMATSPAHFYAAPDARALLAIYDQIARSMPCGLGPP